MYFNYIYEFMVDNSSTSLMFRFFGGMTQLLY